MPRRRFDHPRAGHRGLPRLQDMHALHLVARRQQPGCPSCALAGVEPLVETQAGSPCLAERLQPEVTATDYQLRDLAQAGKTSGCWWWAPLVTAKAASAYCFLCSRAIVSWEPLEPMPEWAGRQVVYHRIRVHTPGARL